MRDLIINRIADLRIREGGFPKNTMRWKNIFIGQLHISLTGKADFERLSDQDLFDIYNQINNQYMKQM